jgi:hypothetical protein
LRERLTRPQVKIEIRLDGFQFLGKAVKIGHGPATVIGCRWESRWIFTAHRWLGRKSGNLLELVEADTLRARECGETPRSVREAFLLREGIFWRQAKRDDGFL